MEFFKCPLCGCPLSMEVTKDSRGKFRFEFFCEGDGADAFNFEISTGLSNRDIAELKQNEVLKKEMKVTIIEKQEKW